MNGSYSGNQITDVGGTFWISSTAGLTANEPFTAHQDLYVNGPVDLNQAGTVGLDAFIVGGITSNQSFGITGTLNTPLYTAATLPQNVTAGKVVKGTVTVADACTCDPTKLVPVNGIVDARKTMNDNLSIGLDSGVLANYGPTTRLDLPCGNYYLDSISTNASLTIVAHGHTALYVGGDINTNGSFAISVDPTGSFDVFVKGTIITNQKFAVGSLNAPALMRLYLGIMTALDLNQGFLLAGNLYSALSSVDENQSADIYGAIFSGSFTSNQNTTIHYDSAITTQGQNCPNPSTPTGDGGVPQQCKSCGDCGNQACVKGQCGSCTTDADCCNPLMCIMGQCVSRII
jgi:hypothetical protein